MSRKKRVLRRLHLIESDLQKTAKTNSRAMWGIVAKGLTAARDIWQEGLTEKTYLAYGEIYDGLILASQQMAASEEKSIEADTISLCRELLQYLIGRTEQEAAVKKDIVFLPYKASMWDSLESVWKAAYADKEHCNAYVMPVPYCDRNPDGSVAEWHCERDLFPKYVPTLDWQKVDLMAWHPDIIFYHYPYDDYNRVTSLDGRYYSRNLRQCADKLVYIPYFVLEEPCTEESVEHFVTTQGVLNADKVIVQSEAMRELYINILMKRTNQPDRAYWEERISGAGSPKIEKVLTSKKEDFEMPEQWKKLVEGKKVILYNTSLTAMLQNSDKVCDKLRYVFDVFRNRDDVVLWWRPHPLMKSTFHAMRPQYEGEYLGLEKQYIEEGWGIYDESPDLHRAICWSDAYYGDMSSVVALYRVTGKPVVIEDLTNFAGIFIPFDISFSEYNIYFTPASYIDVLISIDINTSKTKIINIINEHNESCNQRFGGVIIGNDNIILFPFRGNEFVYINKISGYQRSIHYKALLGEDVQLGEMKFVKSWTYKGKYFICGYTKSILIVYDIEKDEFRSIYLPAMSYKTQAASWQYMAASADGHLFILHRTSNTVIDVDMDNETINVMDIGNVETFDFIDVAPNYLTFVTSSQKIALYNRMSGNLSIISIPKEYVIPDVIITGISISGDSLYLHGAQNNENIVYIGMNIINCNFFKKGYMFKFEKFMHIFDYNSSKSYFAGYKNGEEFVYFVDDEKNNVSRLNIEVNSEDRIQIIKHNIATNNILSEKIFQSLDCAEILNDDFGKNVNDIVNDIMKLPGNEIYEKVVLYDTN